MMRQPLEEGRVTIARAAGSLTYPAHRSFVGAMNLCPFGHAGDPIKTCTCTEVQITRYSSRISGPSWSASTSTSRSRATSMRSFSPHPKASPAATSGTAITRLGLSARASGTRERVRILKLFGAIADLAGEADIDVPNMPEAIQQRSLDRQL